MNKAIFSKSLFTTFFVVLSQCFGVFLTIFVAKKFGANSRIDVIYYILNIASYLIAIFTGIFKTSLIPFIYSEIKLLRINIYSIQNILLTYFVILLVILTFGMYFLSKSDFYNVIFPFLSDLSFTKYVYYYSIPFIIISVVQSLMSTYTNIHLKFGIAEIVNIVKIFTVLIFVFIFSNSISEISIIIGNVIGIAISFLLTIFYMQKNKLLKFEFDFTNFNLFINLIRKSILPLLTGMFISSQSLISNYFLSLYGSSGSITLLAFSQRFSSIPTLLFSSGFLTVFLTYSSKLEIESRDIELKDTVTKSISFLSFLVLPIILYFNLISDKLTILLLKYTQFSFNESLLILNCLIILLISAFFLQIYSIVFRLYIIKNELNILFFFSIIYFFSNVILIAFILKSFDKSIVGASIGVISSNFVLLFISFFYIVKKYDVINVNYVLKNIFKSLICLCFIFIFNSFINLSFVSNIYFNILATFFTSFSLYFFIQYILLNDDFLSLIKFVKSYN